MIKILSIFILLTFNSFFNANALLDISRLMGEKKIEFGIPDANQEYKEKLETENNKLNVEQTEFTVEERSIKEKLSNVQKELTKIDETLKTASDIEKEYLLKYIGLLNEKKQTLITQQEEWKNIISTLEQKIKNLKIIIDYKSRPPETILSSSYSWKEFQEASKKLYSKITQKDSLIEKKRILIKQKETKNKFLESNKSEKEKKQTELKELEDKIEEGIKNSSIIQERSLLKEEISLLNEKEIAYKLKIKSLIEDGLLKDSEISLLAIEVDKSAREIKEIEKNLIPTNEDVTLAQQELSIESQKSQIAKDSWEIRKAPIKKEIDLLKKNLDELIKAESYLKETSKEVDKILTETRIDKIKTEIDKRNNKLKIIEYEKDRLGLNVAAKKLQFEIIKAYYQSNLDKNMIKPWLSNFKNQKELLIVKTNELNRTINDEVNTQTETIRKIDQIKANIEEIKLKRESIFKGKQKQYEEAISNLNASLVNLSIIKDSKTFTIINDEKNTAEQIRNSYDFTIKQLEAKDVSENIWKRSPKAISFNDLQRSLEDSEKFLIKLFWDTPNYLNPYNIIKSIKALNVQNYIGLLIFILFFIGFLFTIKKTILYLKKKATNKLIQSKDNKHNIHIFTTINTFLEFSLNNFKLLFTWFFLYLHIIFDFKYIFSSIEFLVTPYLIAVFYITTIPIWIYLSGSLLTTAKELNAKLSYLFFTEKTQNKLMFLLTSILYSTAILMPLRQAYINYIALPSPFTNLMSAAYSLILVAIILFYFGKEDILTLVPPKGEFLIWLREKIEKHYYPVFIFFMGLLVLINPYIGYSNLAWYLAFALPSSLAIVYGLFIVHYYIRKWSSKFFLKEENEEIIDKFEQAKVYYGFFIILTFLALSFLMFFLIARIWQFDYTAADLFKNLSQDWVIPLAPGANLGIIEFLTLTSFILAGFVISSLLKKFVFNKLFDIFRTEPGSQNTMFRIAHYIIIALAIILGFATIQLKEFITIVGSFLAVGIGFALKDLAADYVAGLFILIERPIEIGNFIELENNTMGTVQKISARATTIRTARNFSIIVPNKDLVSKQIINWGHGRMSVGFELKILVDYGQDFEKIKNLLRETIQKHPAVLKVPGIAIRLEEFADNGVIFFTRSFVSSRKVRDQWDIASEVRFSIIQAFRENNITIAYPQMVIHKAHISKEVRGLNTMKGIDITFDDKPTVIEENN